MRRQPNPLRPTPTPPRDERSQSRLRTTFNRISLPYSSVPRSRSSRLDQGVSHQPDRGRVTKRDEVSRSGASLAVKGFSVRVEARRPWGPPLMPRCRTPPELGRPGRSRVRRVSNLPEHAAVNREYWDSVADDWVETGEGAWSTASPSWGNWGNSDFDLLPLDMAGMDAIELGCGTAYVSAWMARRGATVVGIDNSEKQLQTARRLASEHGVKIDLIHGNAETVDYPDASFDFAVSEYGAASWADPRAWVPEAWRLLRPDGALAFLTCHPLAQVCSPLDGSLPATGRLERPYFGMYRFDWRDAADEPGGIGFTMTISDWFHLLVETGFVVEDLIEVQVSDSGNEIRGLTSAEWAHQWPAEMAWIARKPPTARTAG